MGVPDQHDRDLHRDPLTGTDDDKIDVFETTLDRMSLDVLGQGELGAVGQFQPKQHVRAGIGFERVQKFVSLQRDMAGRLTVTVQNGRDLAGLAGTTSPALAELGTRLRGNADLGHGGTHPPTAWGNSGAARNERKRLSAQRGPSQYRTERGGADPPSGEPAAHRDEL